MGSLFSHAIQGWHLPNQASLGSRQRGFTERPCAAAQGSPFVL
jgi:hypothetical protein